MIFVVGKPKPSLKALAFFQKSILSYTAQMSLQNTKGFWPVTAAIGGNFFVALIKLFATITSVSSSMFSEAVHSFADTVNQASLLIGLKRSTKKADESFEYGYGTLTSRSTRGSKYIIPCVFQLFSIIW